MADESPPAAAALGGHVSGRLQPLDRLATSALVGNPMPQHDVLRTELDGQDQSRREDRPRAPPAIDWGFESG